MAESQSASRRRERIANCLQGPGKYYESLLTRNEIEGTIVNLRVCGIVRRCFNEFKMSRRNRRSARLRFEVTGTVVDQISSILSAFADFGHVFLKCAGEIVEEFKNMVVRHLKMH
jgi:hypothetical protein